MIAFSDGPQLCLALSRTGVELGEDEVAIVARKAGWQHFAQVWRGESGTRRLLIRPAAPPSPKLAAQKLTAELSE